MKAFPKSWWPIPVMFASVIAVQVLWTGHQDHSAGHASGHFSSATVVFGVAFCIAVLVWALPSHARRRGELWLFVVSILTGALFVMIGNLRVVNAIGGDSWNNEQADRLGPLRSGFTSGHDLAQRAAWLMVVVVALFSVWLWRRRVVSGGVAVSAIVVSVVFPSWVFPGAGLVVLVVAAIALRARRPSNPKSLEPAPEQR